MLNLRSNIFRKYWEILKRNYKDHTHTDEDFKIYYSILKEYSEKDVINAIKNVLKMRKFFPQINEICEFLPENRNDIVPEWIGTKQNVEQATEEEIQKWEEVFKSLEREEDEN